MPILRILLAIALCSVACSKPGEDSEAKRSPGPQPPPGTEVPADLEIPVELAGKVVQTLWAEDLKTHPADFHDENRSAWRLGTLLKKDVFPDGSVIEAIGADGVGISMRHPSDASSPVPVLVLTRRGMVVAAALKAGEPFPDYHGHGGRLRRPGDPMPRLLSPLARLLIRMPTGAAAKPATIATLQIQVGQGVPQTISASQIAGLPSSTVLGGSGESRIRWDLRDIVREVGGEGAILTKVIGDEERAISPEEWENASLRPLLQNNRRGELKFHWASKDGSKAESAVHRVSRLVIEK